MAHFRWHWERRQAVVVRELSFTTCWHPKTLLPAMCSAKSEAEEVKIIDCAEGGSKGAPDGYTVENFLEDILKPRDKKDPLYKMKDFPPREDFQSLLPRHFTAFVQGLPLQVRTCRTPIVNVIARSPLPKRRALQDVESLDRDIYICSL